MTRGLPSATPFHSTSAQGKPWSNMTSGQMTGGQMCFVVKLDELSCGQAPCPPTPVERVSTGVKHDQWSKVMTRGQSQASCGRAPCPPTPVVSMVVKHDQWSKAMTSGQSQASCGRAPCPPTPAAAAASTPPPPAGPGRAGGWRIRQREGRRETGERQGKMAEGGEEGDGGETG